MRNLVATVLLASSTAAAQPPAETPAAPSPAPRREAVFGLAINNPLMWNDGDNVAISVYVRFAPKQIIRVNGARYHYAGPPSENALNLVHHGFNDNDRLDYSGWIEDLSVGWSYYPRRAFDGPSLELAALWRDAERNIYEVDGAYSHRHTREEGVRALLGWSWLFRNRAFAAVAVGASTGYEKGYKSNGSDLAMDESVKGVTANVEGYLRFGLVFGN